MEPVVSMTYISQAITWLLKYTRTPSPFSLVPSFSCALSTSPFYTKSGCVTRRRASRWPRPGYFVSSRRCTGRSSAGPGRRCSFIRTARSRRCSSRRALPGMWPFLSIVFPALTAFAMLGSLLLLLLLHRTTYFDMRGVDYTAVALLAIARLAFTVTRLAIYLGGSAPSECRTFYVCLSPGSTK